jgi:hypothetical protein
MRLIVHACLGVEVGVAGGLGVASECLGVWSSVVFVDEVLGMRGVLAALTGRVELGHYVVVCVGEIDRLSGYCEMEADELLYDGRK